MEAELNDSPTAKKVAKALPLTTSFSTWGEEIYFAIPVDAKLDETAREVVELGDLLAHRECILHFFRPDAHERTWENCSGQRGEHHWQGDRGCRKIQRGYGRKKCKLGTCGRVEVGVRSQLSTFS